VLINQISDGPDEKVAGLNSVPTTIKIFKQPPKTKSGLLFTPPLEFR